MKKILLLTTFFVFLVSCKKDPLKTYTYLVDVIRSEEINKGQLAERLKLNNPAMIAVLPDKKLRVVALRYRTVDPQGNPVEASGTVTYASNLTDYNEKGAILGVHFTIGANAQAPSENMATHEALFALMGYVVAAPDYIGYGLTKNLPHSYHHYENTGRASTDLLFAAKEFFASESRRFPRKLTIMGYSEGGYASLACQKYLESNYVGWVDISHVYAGAGAYDLSASYDYFIKTGYSSQGGTIPMLMLGLDYGDNLQMDKSKLFLEPLLSKYPEWIYSKKYSTDEISEFIHYTDITKFLAPEVFMPNDPNTILLRASLAKNSVVDWTPIAPITLLHGTDDTIVPYVNSEKAYESFSKKGCNVELIPIKNKDHKPAGNDFYLHCMLAMLRTNTKSVSSDAEYVELVKFLETTNEPIFNL